MRIDASKPQDEAEDHVALANAVSTDGEIDARIDAVQDLAGVRDELRRLARVVRTLARRAGA